MTLPVRIAASALAIGAAFLAGRFSRLERIVTRDVVKYEDRTVWKDRIVEVAAKVAVVDKAADTKTVTKVVYRWLPGGVTEAVRTTETARAETAHEAKQESTQATRDVLATKDTRLDESHVTERTERPNWSISLMPGYQFAGSPAVTIRDGLVIGADVDHRFIGPTSLGVWGSTSGAAGIVLRGEF